MKKFSLLLVLVLLLSVFSAFAEGIDLSGMSLDELVELDFELQQRIVELDESKGEYVYPGEYNEGRDLESGSYLLRCIRLMPDAEEMYITIHDSTGNDYELVDITDMSIGDEYRISLEEGYQLIIEDGVCAKVKIK